MKLFIISMLVEVILAAEECQLSGPFPWTWRCENGACVRRAADEVTDGLTLNACKLTCNDDSMLWPRPTGPFSIGNNTVSFRLESVRLTYQAPEAARALLGQAGARFQAQLAAMMDGGDSCMAGPDGQSDAAVGARSVKVMVVVEDGNTALTLDTSEFYQLLINHTADDEVHVLIYADTFFGARHALETLSQLVNYDNVNDALQTVRAVMISDAPVYPVRALTLDTSRNFISLAGLLRTIDTMAMNKLNTFHWHITDTHSFPIEIRSEPRMAQYGAYSPRKVYTATQVLELVEYARVRGVRVLPELDMPAHVGHGWQWGEKAGLGQLAVCLGKEPWQEFCVEPPCGQMNIVNENLFPVLEKILIEYKDLFQPDMFHMGGDEINLNCWKSTPEIAAHVKAQGGDPEDDEEYMKLWIQYQDRAYNIWSNVTGSSMPLILWTSHLTQRPAAESGLDPSKYIIQVWTTGADKEVGRLLKQGYKLIISNYDAWYLDCGFSAWVGGGNNWCTPYKSWQTVYDNSPRAIARKFEVRATPSASLRPSQEAPGSDFSRQILGGSAPLWSEQADDSTLDQKLWPRGAALAERLWAEPETGYAAAERRYVHHRRRMVAAGVGAETVQPEFCHHYEGSCYINS
ncbi:LOW QUALITY PROTEIN: chitooligosaccharidolytic beta-N-acetylglucosaminidase-like [Pollicipes pollicipes]|uniref:LOW QUALITY PROTEIN: chitooligosaccharidolytic beta-N-acetylglucosaminidase-like n=1 Tax=Pollicipes pollicipes TaxID=41117 RepID=UPI0018851710|nr:LOW QUALITY PROTEIN: chitooligosaccharidolytic beta-N-acetylglucosaminidase-like [Pollicipes pollicipes]